MKKISQKLVSSGIEFTMQEPTIYVDSPVTLCKFVDILHHKRFLKKFDKLSFDKAKKLG
jgi:hypothetical protein